MPAFDLKGIRIAEYTNTAGAVTYGTPQSAGDAMSANLELRFSEGRLYAESSLAEFIKKATGGTISIGTKYIPEDAQATMYGATKKTYTVGEKEISGVSHKVGDKGKYVGVTFYAPDMIDGEEKITCVFAHRALFGPPGYQFQTMGESITFQTPTTTGEFLPDHSPDRNLFDVVIVDSADDAIAWQNLMFGYTPAAEA